MKNTVGLKNIAFDLGISINAVSRALRGCNDISEKTRKMVKKKAIELGYVPNGAAQSLKNGISNTIAIIIDDIKSSYFSNILSILLKKLDEHDYHAIIMVTNDKLFVDNMISEDVIKECIRKNVDGVITFVNVSEEAMIAANLYKLPILLFGRSQDGIDAIYTDDTIGGEYAAKYLLDHNVKNFLYVSSPNYECDKRRQTGFVGALKNHNVDVLTCDEIDEIVKRIQNHVYDGVFAFNDELVCNLINKSGIEAIKNKTYFVGFDNVSLLNNYPFQFASISPDYEEICSEAVNIILNKIKSDEKTLANLHVSKPVYLRIGGQ